MKKLNILLFLVSILGMPKITLGMEAWSLVKPKENESANIDHVFKDTDIITIQFIQNIKKEADQFGLEKEYDETMYPTEDNVTYKVMQEIKAPYQRIKSCSVLCRNITDQQTITLSINDISIKTFITIFEFLTIYSDEQLDNDQKILCIQELFSPISE